MSESDYRQLCACLDDYARWYAEGRYSFEEFEQKCDTAIRILFGQVGSPFSTSGRR